MPSATASTTAAEIFPRNLLRKSFVFQNEDATIDMFIMRERSGTTVSSTVHDRLIGGKASIALNWIQDGSASIQERWTVVAASGTPRFSWFETEDVVR